jgi:Cof subfamily protein (haloacid dehalogenase superfamily)
MDGTLLDPSGRISPASAAALRKIADLGIRIILASGRMAARIEPFIRELDLPLDLVAYNGAEVRACRPGGWDPIHVRLLSERTRREVFRLCRDQGQFLNVYADGKLHGFHPAGDYRHSVFYETHSLDRYESKVDRLEALPREGILKLLIIETPANRDRLHDLWEPSLRSHCNVLKSNPEYLEFVDLGTSKASALAFWLERQGLTASELVAFGDAENDLHMLRMAGLGIAMANATPGLLAARSEYARVSPWSNAEDGVAMELARIFAI